jgi:DNA-binding NarL/FixJ family response regulator
VVSDGQELLTLCDKLQPDIVITDPILLDVDSITAVRQRAVDIKFIAFAGKYPDEHIKTLLKVGAEGYLYSDVTDDELIAAVKAVYDHYCVIEGPVQSRIGMMACSQIEVKDYV